MFKRLLCTTIVVLAVTPSWGALTAPQQLCQKKAASQARTFFKTVAKALESCHDKISKGALPANTDCSVEASTAAKITKARTKLGLKLAPSCPDATVASLVFGGD